MVGLCEPPGCWLFWAGNRPGPGYELGPRCGRIWGGNRPGYEPPGCWGFWAGNCPGYEPDPGFGRLWAGHGPESEPAGLPFLSHSGTNTMVACFLSTMILTSLTSGNSPLNISCSSPDPGPYRTSIKCEGFKITVDH
jgi:hypothetical protein